MEKAKKGTPQYEEWLRKYKEKKGKKSEDTNEPATKSVEETPETSKLREVKDILSKKKQKGVKEDTNKQNKESNVEDMSNSIKSNPEFDSLEEPVKTLLTSKEFTSFVAEAESLKEGKTIQLDVNGTTVYGTKLSGNILDVTHFNEDGLSSIIINPKENREDAKVRISKFIVNNQ
jgi:vacuolar-type H+-ATPase subunit I/STV1